MKIIKLIFGKKEVNIAARLWKTIGIFLILIVASIGITSEIIDQSSRLYQIIWWTGSSIEVILMTYLLYISFNINWQKK